MRLTPAAVEQVRELLEGPEPKLLKVGVRNRGCSGLAYDLQYVEKPGAFDELVEQDGVRVLVDSKALFSIIGSEMDWVEDKLNQRFVFRNPNISTFLSLPFVFCFFFYLLLCVLDHANHAQRKSAAAASRSWYRYKRRTGGGRQHISGFFWTENDCIKSAFTHFLFFSLSHFFLFSSLFNSPAPVQ